MEINESQALYIIRSTMELFGNDTSKLSDDELKTSLLEAHRNIANSGITTEEAMNNVTLVNRIYAKE